MKDKLAFIGFLFSCSFILGLILTIILYFFRNSQIIYNINLIILFIFGMVFPIIGLMIGIIALVKKKEGKNLALASIIVSLIWILLMIGLYYMGIHIK